MKPPEEQSEEKASEQVLANLPSWRPDVIGDSTLIIKKKDKFTQKEKDYTRELITHWNRSEA